MNMDTNTRKNNNNSTNTNNTNSGNAAKKEYFIPTLENQDMSLEEFGLEQFKISDHSKDKLWTCSTNCYSRWVTGMYYPTTDRYDKYHPNSNYYYYINNTMNDDDGKNNNSNNGDSSLLQKKQQQQQQQQRQRQKKQKQNQKHQTQTQPQKLTKFGKILSEESQKLLLRYDLIIILEWLKYPEYAGAVENYFVGGSDGGGDDIFTGLLSEPRVIYCSKKSKLAKTLVPLDTKKLLSSPVISSSYNNDDSDNDSNDKDNNDNDNNTVTLLQVLEKEMKLILAFIIH